MIIVNIAIIYIIAINFTIGSALDRDGNATISQAETQGSFCSVQLFGDRTHQVQRSTTYLLQSVSVLRMSPDGPRYDMPTMNFGWYIQCFSRFRLVFPSIPPLFQVGCHRTTRVPKNSQTISDSHLLNLVCGHLERQETSCAGDKELSHITNRDNCKFSKDTFHRVNIQPEDWLSVIKLIHDPRANRIHPK